MYIYVMRDRARKISSQSYRYSKVNTCISVNPFDILKTSSLLWASRQFDFFIYISIQILQVDILKHRVPPSSFWKKAQLRILDLKMLRFLDSCRLEACTHWYMTVLFKEMEGTDFNAGLDSPSSMPGIPLASRRVGTLLSTNTGFFPSRAFELPLSH